MSIGSNVNKKILKTFIYKRIEIDDPNKTVSGKTLQDLLLTSLKKLISPDSRSEKINDDSDLRRAIGHHKESRGVLCGQVMMFEEGTDIAVLVKDPTTQLFDVTPVPVGGTEDGKKREVLQGALFFAVQANHMVILQSQAVTFKALELHINWLLKECSKTMDTSAHIILNNEPTEAAMRAISDGGFRSFKIGSPVIRDDLEAETIEIKDASSVKTHFFANGVDVLKSMLKGAWSDELDIPDGADLSNLKVTVEVKYNRYKHESDSDARKWLDQLARASRHFDPEDTVIETASGKTITGNELRLKERRHVIVHNGIIDRSSAYDELIHWLKDILAEGKAG